MNVRAVPLRAGLGAALVLGLAACGGGGGATVAPPAGIGTGVSPVTPSPTATPTSGPAAGVTLLAANGSTLTASVSYASADAVVLAQAATTPSASTLSQYAATVTVATGGAGTSAARSPLADARFAQAQRRLAADRRAQFADTPHERVFDAGVLRARLSGLRAQAAPARAAATTRTTRSVPGAVGMQRQFKIVTSTIGNAGGCAGGTSSGAYQCYVTITATLEAAGAHGNIWIDNASLATPGEFTNVPGEFTQIAQQFDAFYATETAAFAPAFYPQTHSVVFTYSNTSTGGKGQCDANGNDIGTANYVATDLTGTNGTSIDVVVTDALAGTGEGGYYFVVNEYPQEVFNCGDAPKLVSNDTAMFVITGDNYTPGQDLPQFNETYWRTTDVPRSMAHELQHLLHSRYKVLRPYAATPAGTPTADATFIDEGMAMLAEDLAADGVHIDTPRYTYTYLLEPSLFSLTSFTGYQPNPTSTAPNPPYGWYSNTAGSYGQAYLFERYLYDRFGPGALTAIYNSTAAGVGPVVAAAGGEPFPQLYRDFAVTVAAQSTPVSAAPYAFDAAIVLRGNADVPSRRSGTLAVRHLVFGGPQPPETFAAGVPSGLLSLTPGTSAVTNLIDGATLFLPVAGGGNGATITVAAPAAPSYQGATVQGALPTPAPSSS